MFFVALIMSEKEWYTTKYVVLRDRQILQVVDTAVLKPSEFSHIIRDLLLIRYSNQCGNLKKCLTAVSDGIFETCRVV